jgi:phospholipid/cholesterol/gamma-HCH transport system substrate-binding protein
MGALGENLNELLTNANEISKKINTNLSDDKIKKFINDMSAAADSIKKISADIAEVTSEEKTDLKMTIKNLKSATEKLDKILADITAGDTTIGKLLSDKEMGDDLKKTVSTLRDASTEAKKTLSRFTLFKTYWDYELRYGQLRSEYKSDVGLQIRPKPDKFYYLGIANAGTGVQPAGEKQNTFNLKIGRDIKLNEREVGTVYAGVLRSAGGFGFGVRPFYRWNPWNRLEVYGEAYDFSRVTPSNEGKPRIIAGVRVAPARWFRLGGSVEDAAVEKDFHVNANVVLEDEDLAYLLALIGLARP